MAPARSALFKRFFLVALVAGSAVGVRYLQDNRIEVREARFASTESDGH